MTGLGMALLFPALLYCGFQLVGRCLFVCFVLRAFLVGFLVVCLFVVLLLLNLFFCLPDLDRFSPLPQ